MLMVVIMFLFGGFELVGIIVVEVDDLKCSILCVIN